jgi:hypothetical protein
MGGRLVAAVENAFANESRDYEGLDDGRTPAGIARKHQLVGQVSAGQRIH